MGKPTICIGDLTKAQISFAVTAKLISAFVFATRIVQFLFYLNPKFQASSSFPVLVQVGLCRTCSETTLLVFPRGGSNVAMDSCKKCFILVLYSDLGARFILLVMNLLYFYFDQ